MIQRAKLISNQTALLSAFALWVVFPMAGCKSTPPPPPKPASVEMAEMHADNAARLTKIGNREAAAREWRQAADRYALLNDRKFEAAALHNLAQVQRASGQFEESQANLERAAFLNQEGGWLDAWWRNQIAMIQMSAQTGQTDEVTRRIETLSDRAVGLDYPALRGLFLNELGLWRQAKGDFSEARAAFDQARQAFAKAGDELGEATLLANSARLLESEGSHAAAAGGWSRALDAFTRLADPRGIAESLAGRGRSLLAARQDLPVAERLLRHASRNYQTLNLPEKRIETLQLLAEALKAQGKNEEAAVVESGLK